MGESKHFPSLFHAQDDAGSFLYDDTHLSRHVARSTTGISEDDEATYFPRLAAAWNACASIPTEALEAGVVGGMVQLLKKFAAEADQWADTVSDDYRSPCIEPGAKSAHPGSETVFTIGDLREARTLVAKLGGA